MPPVEYVAAFAASCFIVGAGFAFCIHINRHFTKELRRRLQKDHGHEKLPPGFPDSIKSWKELHFDAEVTAGFLFKLDLVAFFSRFSLILVPGVFVLCFGIAYLIRNN